MTAALAFSTALPGISRKQNGVRRLEYTGCCGRQVRRPVCRTYREGARPPGMAMPADLSKEGAIPTLTESDTDACAAQVRRLWAAFNSGKFSNAAVLFAPKAVYHDTLYPKPFEGLPAIEEHLVKMETAFESGLLYVLDDVCSSSTSAAARWHVELENGAALPFARGASTYKLVRDTESGWLFTEAYDFPEPTVKAAPLVLPMLSLAVKLLRRYPNLLPPPDKADAADSK
jgi:SnoaL-like domain